LKVENIMSSDPVSVKRDAHLRDVISLMITKSIGNVYVVDAENAPIGGFTERELLADLATRGRIDGNLVVGDRMSGAVFRISPEMSAREAAEIMIEKKVRLAVTKESKLIGVETASDILKAVSAEMEDRPLGSIVSPRVITVDSKGKVLEALQIMLGKRIGSVIVTKQGSPFGIFTERDLLRVLDRGDVEKSGILEASLEDLASKPLITAHPGTTLRGAASIMKMKKIKRLPIIQNEKIQGIVTARDLVEAYSKSSASAERVAVAE